MHHLDAAATSWPKPDAVIHAVANAVADGGGNPARGSSQPARSAAGRLEAARRAMAAFLGAPAPERLAFTLNATDALAIALRSLVPRGGRVVTSVLEHAAVLRPLRRVAAESGVELVLLEPGASGRFDPVAVVAAARGARADCVALTCCSNVTGAAQPFAAIAGALRPHGIPLVLDATQAAGTLPLDLGALGPHVAVALTGHKSLLGPMGVGALWVGEAIEPTPLREGGTGDGGDLTPRDMPSRLEAGTLPLPAIAGMAAGVAWWTAQGVDAVRAREASELERLVDGLRSVRGVRLHGVTDGPRAPLVTFSLDGWAPDELASSLDAEHGIVVRAGLHCAPDAHRWLGTHPAGAVRASLGPTTPGAAIDALLAALADYAS